ncbi:MAG: Na/Pi cotransporter family protein, partial [Sulfurimonas sp.]|nr:Na/Pi cotransporter family protein [Sulfurimonas sp.]
LTVSTFTKKLVHFLEARFIEEENIDKAKYLDDVVITVPEAAIKAITKEVEHLYDNAVEVLSHALSLHRHHYIGATDISCVVKESNKNMNIDIDEFYYKNIKELYGQILCYTTEAQEYMDTEQKSKVYELKISCRDIVEAIKDVRELQKNLNLYLKSGSFEIKQEYNFLREEIAKTINTINSIRHIDDDLEVLAKIELLMQNIEKLDMIDNGHIDSLIRNNKIETKMATSLINDSSFTYDISKNLINAASLLWIKDSDIKNLRSGYET